MINKVLIAIIFTCVSNSRGIITFKDGDKSLEYCLTNKMLADDIEKNPIYESYKHRLGGYSTIRKLKAF